jgi:CubicO group peptidase (beta-lactamase class C family)
MLRRFLAGVLLFVLGAGVPLDAAAQPAEFNARADSLLSAYHGDRLFNGAVVVGKGDSVVFSGTRGDAVMEWDVPNTLDTRFHIGSVTKQFTAALVLSLVEDGQVALDSTVATYLPDYPGPGADRITIHHLLSHRSGLPSYTSFPDYQPRIMRLTWEPDSLLATVAERDLDFEPGSQFTYSNSGYFLLGRIVEAVTGQAYDEALQERVLAPAGLADAIGYAHHHRVIDREAAGYRRAGDDYERAELLDSSVPYSAGMLYATPTALHRWSQALLNGEVLPDSLVDAMTTPHSGNGYGYGIVTRTDTLGGTPVTTIGHDGGVNGFTSSVSTVRADDAAAAYTVVVLDNTSSPRMSRIGGDLRQLLYGERPEKLSTGSQETIDVPVETLEDYTGVYAARPQPNFKITVTREGEKLFTQATGQQQFRVYPESTTRFFLKVVDAEVEFQVAQDGSVPSLTLYQNGREIVFDRE